MKKFARYCKIALDKSIDHALVVETSSVFTAPWVRIKCRFGCPGYGKRLCCPPFTPDYNETRIMLDSYRHAILLHRHWIKDYKALNDFNDIVVDLERTLFLDGYYKAFGMGSGPCKRCRICDTSTACRNPEKARPSMESCGIDVFRTARELGLPIRVLREQGEERDTYGIVLIE